MININILGLKKQLDEKNLISIITYTNEIKLDDYLKEKNNNYDDTFKIMNNENSIKDYKNIDFYNMIKIEILTFEIYKVFETNINLNKFNFKNQVIIFYNFIQPIKIGLKVNSQYISLEKNLYMSGNFKIEKDLTFEIDPIDVQIRIIDNVIFFSLSYSISTDEDTNIFIKYKNSNSKKDIYYKTINNTSNFNYIDIDKEFI